MPTYEEILQENVELRRRVAEQERQIASLTRQIEDLKKQVEELRRRGKRQAAPFSKGKPSEDPKRQGAKLVSSTASKRRAPGPSGRTRRSRWIALCIVSIARARLF